MYNFFAAALILQLAANPFAAALTFAWSKAMLFLAGEQRGRTLKLFLFVGVWAVLRVGADLPDGGGFADLTDVRVADFISIYGVLATKVLFLFWVELLRKRRAPERRDDGKIIVLTRGEVALGSMGFRKAGKESSGWLDKTDCPLGGLWFELRNFLNDCEA
jgi:hypothetical protein